MLRLFEPVNLLWHWLSGRRLASGTPPRQSVWQSAWGSRRSRWRSPTGPAPGWLGSWGKSKCRAPCSVHCTQSARWPAERPAPEPWSTERQSGRWIAPRPAPAPLWPLHIYGWEKLGMSTFSVLWSHASTYTSRAPADSGRLAPRPANDPPCRTPAWRSATWSARRQRTAADSRGVRPWTPSIWPTGPGYRRAKEQNIVCDV